MNPEGRVVVEIVGEGKTDIGETSGAESPSTGVLPILVHALCGKPQGMRVKRKRYEHLQKGSLERKANFARRQARYNGSDGVVFVVDSEGGEKERKDKKRDLERGRDTASDAVPMAIGVAHPCIEAWLLADPAAIRRACRLGSDPQVPSAPEQLSAPRCDANQNPKTALRRAARTRHPVEAAVMWRMAASIQDLDVLRNGCPLGFAPFAAEVGQRIRSLFH